MDKILTVNDVAEILQVKPITVREMFRTGRLRGFKIGKAWRIDESTLEADLAAMRRGNSRGPDHTPETDAGKSAPKSERLPKPAARPSPPAESIEEESEAATRKPARRKQSKRVKEESPEKDDSQQLLF